MKGPGKRHAWTAKVGEKGQIVIPKEARDLFDISPGDTLLLLGDARRGIAIVNGDNFSKLFDKVLESEQAEEPEDE